MSGPHIWRELCGDWRLARDENGVMSGWSSEGIRDPVIKFSRESGESGDRRSEEVQVLDWRRTNTHDHPMSQDGTAPTDVC